MTAGGPPGSSPGAASPDGPLLHLVAADAWSLVDGAYAPDSLATEGFVHLSAPHQVARVAAARFAGRSDLLVLVVDPAQLGREVVWEDAYGEGERFPHVYGRVPREAVVAVHAYLPGTDGTFPPPWEVSEHVPAPAPGDRHEPTDTVRFVDVSRAGHPLSRGRLDGLPPSLPLGELLERRVRAEVAAHHAAPSRTVRGLVQPHDAIRYADGGRMPAPRPLDVDAFVAAVHAALAAGHLHAQADGVRWQDAHTPVPVAGIDELTVVLQRPVIADDRPR